MPNIKLSRDRGSPFRAFFGRGRHWPHVLAGGLGLAAASAHAQDASWLVAPPTSLFGSGANWSTGTTPIGTASFGASTGTTVDVIAPAALGTLWFNAGAPAYTLNVSDTLQLGTGGIVNNSSNTQTFSVTGAGVLTFNAGTAANVTINTDATVNFNNSSTAGSSRIVLDLAATVNFSGSSTAGNATLVNNLGGSILFNNASTAGNASINNSESGGFNSGLQFNDTSSAGNATINNDNGSINFFNSSTAGNATFTNLNGGVLLFQDTSSAGSAAFTNSASITLGDTSTAGTATFTNNNGGTLTFNNSSTAGSATIVTNSGGSTRFTGTSTGGVARAVTNAGGAFDISQLTSTGMTVGSIEGAGTYSLGSKQLTVGGNNLSTTVSGIIANGGLGGGTGGSLVKTGSGTLTLTGANTYTGATTVGAGMLALNGSLTSNTTVGAAGTLGGIGTIFGSLAVNGTIAPGNSIGTLNVNGSFTQGTGSIYQLEVNAAGQSDRITVTGAPGTATINGGTVAVTAAPGSYNRSTTYTILSATGGRTGTYAGVTSNFAFLTPTLTYDANDVFLTLAQSTSGFADGARTPNQRAVGQALDQAGTVLSGDLATVLGALRGLDTTQGPAALDALSGQAYSAFGTTNLSSSRLFTDAFGRQMAIARSGETSSRLALAEACEPEICDATGRWSAWATALGGFGNVAGNGNASTLTYNIGGAASGIDYRVEPGLLVGLAVGYTSGTQWVGGFSGRGTSDSYYAAVYAGLDRGSFYVDGAVGYGYSDNQLHRVLTIPGLPQRDAFGRTGAHQLFGQVEAGHRFDLDPTMQLSATPFTRLEATGIRQAAFGESGAGDIDLNVTQQTTASMRTTAGAEIATSVDAGWRERLALKLRFGWSHEFADTARPVTASFARAPAATFTIQGPVAQRDSLTIGFGADTRVSDTTRVYFRYDGDFGGANDSHAFSAGLRFVW